MLNAEWYDVIQIVITSLIGMLGVGMCLEKYWERRMNIFQQFVALVGGLALIYPGTLTDIIGIVLVGAVIVWQKAQKNILVFLSDLVPIPLLAPIVF